METQPGIHTERADASPKVTTQPEETAAGGKNDANIKLQMNLDNSIKGVISNNAVNDMKTETNEPSGAPNGKENESTKKSQPVIMDSVSQTIQDVASGILAPDPCAPLRLKEEQEKLQQLQYQKANQSSVTQERNSSTHSRFQNNVSQLHTPPGGFNVSRTDPYQFPSHVPVPTQSFSSQQFSQGRLPPNHPSMNIASQLSDSANQNDTRKPSLPGNSQNPLSHQTLPGNSNVNSSLAQNQTSGAIDNFHSSSTAGHNMPSSASIHSVPSIRPQSHELPKSKGVGRRPPRPQTQGAEPQVQNPYMQGIPRRMPPMFDPRFMQMVRSMTDPRFMPDPRMIPPQMMPHFIRMQQMAKQHMASQAQQHQPPQAHVSQPQGHGEVSHYQGAPQPAHSAHAQHLEIAGHQQRLSVPNTQPSQEAGLTTLSEFPHSVTAQQQTYPVASHVASGKTTVSVSNSATPPILSHSEQQRTDSINYASVQTFQQTSTSSASTQQVANQLDQSMPISSQPLALNSSINTLSISTSVTQSTIPVSASSLELANSQVNQVSLASSLATQPDRPSSKHSMENPPSNHSVERPSSVSSTSSIHDSHKLVGHITSHSNDTPHQVGSETIGGPQSCTTPVTSAGNSISQPSVTSSVSVGGHGVVSVSSFAVSSSQCVQMSTCTTQTPYGVEEDGTEKTASQTKLVPALSQHEQPSPLPISVNQVPPATGTTSSMLPSTSVTTVAATTGMPSQPRMPSTTGQHSLPTHGPPQFPPSSMTGGLVRTPFGMLPHHPPGISQAGGLPPYGGMRPFPVPHSQMPANMPPGLALPPNMRMPHGFPPGFSMPPMQRMPGAMGSMQSAMASMAQQAQQMTAEMAVSSHDQTAGRLPSPVSSAGGPRMSQSTSAPTSQQLENLFRMSMGMRPSMAQQHGMRPPPGVRLPTNQGQQLSRMPGQMMPGMIPPAPTSEASRMMSPNQQGKDPTGTQPDGARKLVGPPSLPSPAASSTPSPKVLAPTPPLKMDQPGVMDPVAMAELIRNTEVKQEQLEGGENKELTQEEIDQNALLKALLKSSKGGGAGQMQRQLSTMSEVNPCKQDSEDAPMLTPDQQRQLDLIEKMPLVTETDWDLKTQEERNHIIEMRKQAYEQKRKEFEQLRKMKRKSPGEPRKRKKKEKVEGEGQVMANAGDPTAVPTQPKKRQRKTKKQTQGGSEEDLEAKADDFLQKLRALPTVALQEPKVGDFFNVSPIPGCPSVVTGDSALKGSFGKAYLEDVADFYGNTLLKGLPPLGSLVGLPRDESRRKYLGVRSVESSSEHHGYQLAPENIPHVGSKSGTVSKPMQSFKSPLIDMGDKPVMPSLPPSPRIEPRLDPVLRGDESPCTIVSSSSPEHDFGDGEEEDYPMLKPIDPAQSTSNDRSSPLVPEYHQPNPVRLDSLKIKEDLEEFKKENIDSSVKSVSQELVEKKIAKLNSSISEKENMKGKIPSLSSLTQPFRDANLNQDISVTLTLSANAAEDIGGVLSQIADLLKIAVPPSYEISGSPSPEMYKMNMKHKEEPVNIHSLIKSKAKFCRHCDMVVFDSGYRKKRSEIPFLVKDDYSFKDFDDDEVTFCSEKCYSQFASIYQMIHKPPPQEFREDFSSFPNRTFAHSMGVAKPSSSMFNLMSPASNDSLLPTTPTKSDMSLTPTPSTPTSGGTLTPVQPSPPIRQRSEEKMAKKHKRTSSMDVQPPKAIVKKWKDRRYKKWDPSFTQTLETAPGVPESEIENIWKAHQAVIVPKPTPKDDRVCAFCQIIGDGETDGPGRLLNMDINKWAHLNCALWSSEVYETLNGALMNVDGAYTRGQSIDCALCKTKGATVGCFNMRCPKYYHLGCAKNAGCMFFQDKTILCPVHAPKQDAENVLESLVVYRRVYINRNEDKQVANMVHGQEDGNHTLRVGSLILHSVGQLLPHQIQTGKFHTRDYIYPVGFKSSRLYWSMKRLYKRCRYNCSITEREGRPWFNICVVEPGCEDVIFEDNSPRTVWNKILEPLDKLRRAADLVKIFPYFITGEELFGLTEPSVVRVIESLPGTDLLTNYLFKFSRSLRIEMPLTINPTGCARTEPKLRTHFRKPHTLQSSNTSSRSLPSTVTGFTGDMNSPYMKQFVHSKSQQYRRLKTEWRNIVYLGRSRIQGLGLYAARDLEKHTMVIEYIGHLIRNEVANRKEISYEEQNRGVYMFRIDNETVVDATMAGGPARYINHSCNPNCVAEVVPFDKESKIIIITNRRIPRGEELTYDYKFDFEDDQHKIPCCCGAPKCRKWMN